MCVGGGGCLYVRVCDRVLDVVRRVKRGGYGLYYLGGRSLCSCG